MLVKKDAQLTYLRPVNNSTCMFMDRSFACLYNYGISDCYIVVCMSGDPSLYVRGIPGRVVVMAPPKAISKGGPADDHAICLAHNSSVE